MANRQVCALRAVVDTHTLLVDLGGPECLIRLLDVNPEPATVQSANSPSETGRQTLRWAREHLFQNVSEVEIEEPDTEPAYSKSGKRLCYVWVRGECLNVRLVRDGHSPYFCKYGHARLHHEAFQDAELWARREALGIWGLPTAGQYARRSRWWWLRAGQVESFRHCLEMGEDILCAWLDHDDIISRAKVKSRAVVFADLAGVFEMADGSVLLQLGNPRRPLCALFAPAAASFARFLVREHLGAGKPNFLYFSAVPVLEADQPQLNIESMKQVTTYPPRENS